MNKLLDLNKLKILILLLFIDQFLAQEILPIEIPLLGEASERNLEMSGLAWYKDNLILMPQYVNESTPAFYFLTKSSLRNWLNGDRREPLTPQRIDVVMPDYDNLIKGYQGFEAICFNGKDAYLTMESKFNDKMKSFIVKGKINMKNKSLEIEKDDYSFSEIARIVESNDAKILSSTLNNGENNKIEVSLKINKR